MSGSDFVTTTTKKKCAAFKRNSHNSTGATAPTTQQRNNAMKTLSAYDQEALTSLYAAADFMACNDIPTDSVMAAIEAIESKLR